MNYWSSYGKPSPPYLCINSSVLFRLHYHLFAFHRTFACYFAPLKPKTKAPSLRLASSASCHIISWYFVAELSEVSYVLTFSTSPLPVPSSSQALAPTAPPKLMLPSYGRPSLSLIQQADLSPQLIHLALCIGHSWSFPPQFTFFPWLPGHNIGCFLLLRSLIAPSQSPFIHSVSHSLPFNVIMPQSSVLFSVVGLNTTYMPTTPKCKLPAQSFLPNSTLPTQNLHLRV